MPITKLTPTAFEDNVKFRNIIINGDMSIAQRGTSVTGVTSTQYVLDRFKFEIATSGTWTVSQSTDVPSGEGFVNSFKADCTTADSSLAAGDAILLTHKIEGQNVQYLNYGSSSAKKLTLSFWVKSAKTGTYIIELDQHGNEKDYSQSYTINTANTWEKKILTFNGDTSTSLANNNSEQLEVTFWLAAGSNFSSGTLNTSWNTTTNANRAVGQVNLADSTDNEWYVTGVQLEAGEVATPFEFLPYDVNLQRCRRYFYNIQTLYLLNARWKDSGGSGINMHIHPIEMRATPTGSNSGTFSTGAGYAGEPGYANATSKAVALTSAGSVSANDILWIHNGTMNFDAEL